MAKNILRIEQQQKILHWDVCVPIRNKNVQLPVNNVLKVNT